MNAQRSVIWWITVWWPGVNSLFLTMRPHSCVTGINSATSMYVQPSSILSIILQPFLWLKGWIIIMRGWYFAPTYPRLAEAESSQKPQTSSSPYDVESGSYKSRYLYLYISISQENTGRKRPWGTNMDPITSHLCGQSEHLKIASRHNRRANHYSNEAHDKGRRPT